MSAAPLKLREITSKHESGHAVMRWLCGLRATALTVHDGGGFCAGTGQRIRADDALYVALAGMAVEAGYGLATVDWEASDTDDLREARSVLERVTRLRIVAHREGEVRVETVDEALNRHFAFVCDLLSDHWEVIEDMGNLLADAGHLSARRVSALLREHGVRRRRGL